MMNSVRTGFTRRTPITLTSKSCWSMIRDSSRGTNGQTTSCLSKDVVFETFTNPYPMLFQKITWQINRSHSSYPKKEHTNTQIMITRMKQPRKPLPSNSTTHRHSKRQLLRDKNLNNQLPRKWTPRHGGELRNVRTSDDLREVSGKDLG